MSGSRSPRRRAATRGSRRRDATKRAGRGALRHEVLRQPALAAADLEHRGGRHARKNAVTARRKPPISARSTGFFDPYLS